MTSAFDTLSDNYWQQFCQDVPVGGGMAYQSRLKDCQLDLSKDSLQRVDGLLVAIKKELLSKTYEEAELLKQSSFRNFVFFVGFYTARVLACHHVSLSWQPINDKKYQTHAQDKFYTLAAAVDDKQNPLFILMTVGARLFSSFDRPFYHPINQALTEDSLYWLVDDYLKQVAVKHLVQPALDVINTAQAPSAQNASHSSSQSSSQSPVKHIDSPIVAVYEPPSLAADTHPAPPSDKKVQHHLSTPQHHTAKDSDDGVVQNNDGITKNDDNTAHNGSSTVQNDKRAEQKTLSATSSQSVSHTLPNHSSPNHSSLNHSLPSQQHRKKTAKPAVDFFAEAKRDLDNLAAVNDTNKADFDKAYRYIHTLAAKDDSELSDQQKTNRIAAVKLMAKTAQAGNTSAMIALGMYYFGGVGVQQDEQKGFAIIQKAADLNDVRAQKLLSRLYYQGYGVKSSIQMGEFWLNRAADNGHAEAAKIVAQINYSKLLQDDFRVESQKEQRYFMMMALVAVGGILLFWLAGKVLS